MLLRQFEKICFLKKYPEPTFFVSLSSPLSGPFKISIDGEEEPPAQAPPLPVENCASKPIRTPGRNKKQKGRRGGK